MHQVPLFEPPPKRKRGRPRKIRPPKFDWTVWTSDSEAQQSAAVVPQPTAPAAMPPAAPPPQPPAATQPLVSQYVASGPRLRAGERWKRRIRVPGGGPLHPRSSQG